MPRKRKPLKELTTEEAMKYLFPKPVRVELFRLAQGEMNTMSMRKPKRGKK